MKKKNMRRALFVLVMAVSLTVAGKLLLFSDAKVSGQQEKGWRVWVKTSPCSGGRTDWVSVATENPATGGGGSAWALADLISPMICTKAADNGCDFALANVVAGNIRASNRFFDYCCHDYSVWENTSSKETSVVRGSGSAGFGWQFVKGDLCCEEAEAMTGKTGLCGKTTANGGGSCFTSDPGMGSSNRDEHYNWGQGQSASQLEANLKSKINLLYNCSSLSDEGFANAFADFSVVIANYAQNAACFSGDRGVTVTDRNAHYQWARTKPRRQLLENLQWKTAAAFKCLNGAGQKTFFADLSVSIAKTSPAATANTGGSQPTPTRTPPPVAGNPGQRACSADEADAFAKMTGSWKSYRMHITVGGSCEQATGTFKITEWCEGVDETYNASVARITGTFKGRMTGGSLQVAWEHPPHTKYPAAQGTGYCSLNSDGSFSCSGFGCENKFKTQ